ncbi:MAG: AMP-binding protein [Pararhodobacter sp.]
MTVWPATRPILPGQGDHAALCAGFGWALPARLNMARQVCFDWLDQPRRVAIIDLSGEGRRDISYGALAGMAAGLAAHLAAQGVARGDRVGVLRSQDPWCAAAHIAIWSLGAISLPLFKPFGPDALATRLRDAGAHHVITDPEGAERLRGVDLSLVPHLPEELTLDAAAAPDIADTGPDDPAVLIYTSGTTGAPKGALHGHRILTGHLPGVEISHDRLGQPGDVIWTPADWAWIGGLFDVLMPGLAIGVPVVAARMTKFTPEGARDIIRAGTVRNVFFPPTALKLLKAEGMALPGLRSVASGGEPLGAEMLDWGRRAFGLNINEFYGQTECNMVASAAASLFPPRPGCIGRAVPGFDLAVLGPDGVPLCEGAEGDIAVRRGAASMFLGYWNRPDATAEKFRGDWMLTGDRGLWEAGYLRFHGREDDVITSAGYRIGPAEIEDCLMQHPDVALAAVIGVPDAARTERIRACIVPRQGATPDAQTLQDHVRHRLSAHLVPREVVLMESLPMTVTGKIIRKELKRLAAKEDNA